MSSKPRAFLGDISALDDTCVERKASWSSISDDMKALYASLRDNPMSLYAPVRLWRCGCTPVIYEFEDGELKLDVTWKSRRGQTSYCIGDLIWRLEQERRYAARRFKALGQTNARGGSILGSILRLQESIEPTRVTTAWRITDINPITDGNNAGEGKVSLQGVVLIDDEFVDLEESWIVDCAFLCTWWIAERRAHYDDDMLRVHEFMLEGTTAVATGAGSAVWKQLGKKAVSRGGRYATKKALNRVFFKVLTAMKSGVASASIDFIRTFATTLCKKLNANEVSSKFGRRLDHKVLVQQALLAASNAFVVKLIDVTISGPTSAHIKRHFNDVRGIVPGFDQRFKAALTNGLVQLFTTEAMEMLLSAVTNAINESFDRRSKFDEKRFAEKLSKQLQATIPTYLEQKFAKVLDDAAGQLF